MIAEAKSYRGCQDYEVFAHHRPTCFAGLNNIPRQQ